MLHSNPVPAVPLDRPPKEQQVHGLNVTPEELESLRQGKYNFISSSVKEKKTMDNKYFVFSKLSDTFRNNN